MYIQELKKQLAGAQGAGDRLKNEAERKESLMKVKIVPCRAVPCRGIITFVEKLHGGQNES